MLYTTYFAKLRSLPEDVIPVAICAKPPIGFKGYTFKQLAPKYDAFKHYKETKDEEQFTNDYYNQVLNSLNPVRVFNELYELIDKSEFTHDIALVCYEKPTDFCHRKLVANWFNSKGLPCKEYTYK